MLPWGQVDPIDNDHPPNFYITGTDYDNFIVVYSCVDGYIANMQNVWVMTRENNPSDETLDKVRESLAETIPQWELNWWNFKTTYHGEDCVYEQWSDF